MSRLLKHAFFAALGLILALAPLAPAQAQNVKPVAVVSIASWEKLKADTLYISELVGQKDGAESGLAIGQIYLSGIDLKRPMGAYVTLSANGEPRGVAFIPVTKLDPGRCVITGLLPTAHLAVDPGRHKAGRNCRAE